MLIYWMFPMGFVAGLMEEVALPFAQQDRILDCISEKNIHGFAQFVRKTALRRI